MARDIIYATNDGTSFMKQLYMSTNYGRSWKRVCLFKSDHAQYLPARFAQRCLQHWFPNFILHEPLWLPNVSTSL